MRKYADVILGELLVVGVTYTACLYARHDSAAWAQVVILGVTALVVVWYAHQARRTADETRSLANSTRALMQSNMLPNLLLEPWGSTPIHRSYVVNRGLGLACDIECRTLNPADGVEEISIVDLAPSASSPNIIPTHKAFRATLDYKDVFDKHYHQCWEFDGLKWFAIHDTEI